MTWSHRMEPSAWLLEHAESQIGRTLRGKWTLLRVIGMGGMAVVYEGVHRNGKHVAVKVLHPNRAADPRVRQRFLREGYAANRVGHPLVVTVDDDDVEEDGTTFLVMELLEGESLEARRRKLGGRLPPAEAIDLGA